jgi:hypothetical protein
MLAMVLIFGLHYSALASPAEKSQRNLGQFGYMIYHKGYNPFDYDGYGCW